jgi:hypothetical protein
MSYKSYKNLRMQVVSDRPGGRQLPPLNIGDRVELIPDIGHHYSSRIGIVSSADEHPVSALRDYVVSLADGTTAAFSGFQLRTLTRTVARKLHDSAIASSPLGVRGALENRHLLFGAEHFEIHLRVAASTQSRQAVGQVTSEVINWEHALVTLLVEDTPRITKSTDRFGEFMIEEIPAGNVSLEVLVPSYRVVASFET